MRWFGKLFGVLLVVGLLARCRTVAGSEVAESFFETQIRPVLISRCFECHGQTEPKGGLRVDSRDALLTGGDSGPAIRVGKASESLLIQAIKHDDSSLQMPPKAALPKNVVDDFTQWVNDGAAWPQFELTKSRKSVSIQRLSMRRPDDEAFKSAIQLWLKVDGHGLSSDLPVYLWEDSSGRGHDLSATLGARPGGTGRPGQYVAQSRISGFPAIRFNPDTGLGGNAATAPAIEGDAEFTLMVVARLQNSSISSVGLLAGFGDPASPVNPNQSRCAVIGFETGTSPRPILVGGWGYDAKPASDQALNSNFDHPVILTLTRRAGSFSSTATFRINGKSLGTLTGEMADPNLSRRSDLGFFLGHAQSWAKGFEGDLAEVLLYNKELPLEELAGVEAHLSDKYRIPLDSSKPQEIVNHGDPAFRPNHWAFEPIKSPVIPEVSNEGFLAAIDRFISDKWKQHGLVPVADATPQTLIRRLYFDLIGIPPTPEQMSRSISALTPWNEDAWKQLIEELLSSPHYGERWGRHWLDVVRYADTAGDNADYPVPEAIYYRDYVIDSFNKDKPYDNFITEQLAGDLLAKENPNDTYAEKIAATGFLALSRRYATAPYELWHLTLEDTIDTVGQGFMGLTFRCARCHDHKFDPISQNDYYALYGIFDSTQFPWAGGEEFQSKKAPREHFIPLIPQEKVEPLLAEFHTKETQLKEQLAEWEKQEPLTATLKEMADALATLKTSSGSAQDIADLQKKHDKTKREYESKRSKQNAPLEYVRRRGYPATIPVAYAVKEATPRQAYLQRSGDPGSPGPVIARGTPTFLTTMDPKPVPDNASGRLQLAQWLTDPRNPLTARVMVNRIWQHHFGQGLVATSNNFGTRGSPPVHPELLDWLSSEFVHNGWSIKSLHRMILTSRVWRLASMTETKNASIDPANQWIWRHQRRRLEAEAIRDAMLATNQRLDRRRPGAHPFPDMNSWKYTQHSQFKDFYPSLHRSIYLMTTRLQRHPFLSLFDGPDTNATTGNRTSSIVSAQSLYLMNSDDVKREAVAFAESLLKEPSDQRIEMAWQRAFQRLPTPSELDTAGSFLTEYAQHADEAQAWTALCRSLMTSHEFFYVD